MLFSKYLNSFVYFNLLLIFFFSLSVNKIESFTILNLLSYSIFHFIVIYLSLYYHRNILYFIFFLFGLSMDLLFMNSIGPHLLVFMILLFSIKRIKKYINNFESTKIYFIILLIQIIILFLEMIISHYFYQYYFDHILYSKLLLISLFISYPLLLIFSKIDEN
ncbi:MAG: hypothetical protein CFH18_00162 [Alphaproteobacteria bacterium MarineAlpha5_Bin8]|nr:MAG: hypothetical protein CFH17_00975 [Alphaproteobacteria bacterium MarineAlpha5_Bin7]PPR48223.1 MAG: hypothetical protein CFH18_00162 [Alphaproteobacteria bacterium MarineAlpha5_Bin8]